MNIQLVESLAKVIKALSPEERELLNKKLIYQSNWQNLRSTILANAQAIQERRGGRLFEPNIDEIIHQMREQREQELLVGLLSNKEEP